MSLSNDKRAKSIQALWTLLTPILDNKTILEGMANLIYPPDLQLIEANDCDTDAAFLNLNLPVYYGYFTSKIYDKRDDFDLAEVNSRLFAW